MLKVIIAGGRDFADYDKLRDACDEHLSGVNEFGPAAGVIRNAQMADYGNTLIVFWDGKSRGTKNMIDTAKKKQLEVSIVKYASGNE